MQTQDSTSLANPQQPNRHREYNIKRGVVIAAETFGIE